MRSLHLIDPELSGIVPHLPAIEITDALLPELRSMQVPWAEAEFSADGVAVETRAIPGPTGAPELRVLIFRPPGLPARAPALLHIHGGGLISGRPEMYTARARSYALAGRCIVVSTSYRHAPETRWPGAVEDVYAALCWLHANAASLGVDGDAVAIGGESAGGGLAAALALHARARGGPSICLQLLVCPMLDDRTRARAYAGEIAWTEQNNSYGWTSYLGMPAGSAAVPPEAVPARNSDLAGLPAAFIATSSLDLFVHEDIEYARRLIEAGVPTGLFVAPGAYHGFDFFLPEVRISKKFIAETHGALAAAFAYADRHQQAR